MTAQRGADPHTQCPDCRFIAPPEAMSYSLTETGGIDWDRPVNVICPCCHAHHTIGAGDVLPLDSETTCHRCGTPVACPAGAARVRCGGCGLFLLGPGLNQSQREELCITEGLARLGPRETYLAARDRAATRRAVAGADGDRRGGPGGHPGADA